MKRRKASGRLRVVVSIVAVVATGVAVARRAEADGIEQRTDVREELTAATTADTLFNPGGQVFVAKPATNRLRARSEVTVQLPAAIAFKAIGTLEALHAPGDRAALEWAFLTKAIGR